jgi:hypothetical protein
MKLTKALFLAILFSFLIMGVSYASSDHHVMISDIYDAPQKYVGKEVSVSGFYCGWKNAPGAPPVSRSDWVIANSAKKGIYCVGNMPQDDETGEMLPYWKPIVVKGTIELAKRDKTPFIRVKNWSYNKICADQMVSVFQIIAAPKYYTGVPVSIMGVLAKGYGIRGDRMYLLADPTGVIKLGRLPKLYPKGTILHLRGIVSEDENKLPMLDALEILSAKVE